MGMTDELIAGDIAAIFTDLRATSIVETVSRIPAGETAAERTFEVVRAKKKTAQELMSTGYSRTYRFTVYAQRADVGETEEGDILVMASGDRLRVFRPEEGPSRTVIAFDLGDEFEDGEDLN